MAVTLLGAACAGVGPKLSSGAQRPAAVAGAAAQASPAPTAPTTRPPGATAIAPAPDRFDGPAPARKRLPRQFAAEGGPAPGTWAVIVGVDDYPGTAHDLRSAGADADDVNAALAGMGVPDSQRLLVKDGQVTRSVLRSAVEWLTARAGPDAVAVFFFAGHVRKVGRTTEAMVAADGGTVTDAELAELLAPLRAHRSWVAIAACFGGGFTEVLRPGRIVTGAAPADQEAYENLTLGRSYLVQYMVREAMIEGRAPDTVQSAFEYARAAISRDFPDRDRTPIQLDQAGGPLDLRQPGARPARPPSGEASASTATSPSESPSPSASPASDAGPAPTAPARPSARPKAPRRAPTSTTTTAPDRCRKLTGLLRCGPD